MADVGPPSGVMPTPSPDAESNGWAELRRLLLEPEQEQLGALKTHLEEREAFMARVSDVSEVLPQAILQRSRQDGQLTRALAPTIEEAIKLSVQKDPRPLVEAVFPVLGPAVRMAIVQAFKSMLQALNRTLEYSLSVRGLLWRLEGVRTGKSFAEIVLLRTMLYRVEQVFLIHKTTGLLLQHVETSHVAMGDAEMIAAMLTAIQDFVRDSFHTGETLDTFQVGDLSIWVEQGPHAILAAVIRGNPPYDIRLVFQDTLAILHREYGPVLTAFAGDAAAFLTTRQPLESCLLERTTTTPNRFSPVPWGIVALLLAGVALWQWTSWRERQLWWQYVEQLQTTPGIVVTTAHKQGGKYILAGLRDPLAQDPVALLATTAVPAERVRSRWEPYYALVPEFTLTRARVMLEPPDTVTLHYHEGILQATGRAPHVWITEARRLGKAVPGVQRFEMSQVIDHDQEQFDALVGHITARMLLFERNTVTLIADQEKQLPQLLASFQNLEDVAIELGRRLQVTITGHADPSGSETTNLRLSQQRAEYVLSFLQQHAWVALRFTAVGKGAQALLRFEQREEESGQNRRVSFIVNVLPGLSTAYRN